MVVVFVYLPKMPSGRAGIRIPLVWPLSPLSPAWNVPLTLPEGRTAVQAVLSICGAAVEETALGVTWRKHLQKVLQRGTQGCPQEPPPARLPGEGVGFQG